MLQALSNWISGKKLGISHVESGLRRGEEVNRILRDHITTYSFVTEQSGGQKRGYHI